MKNPSSLALYIASLLWLQFAYAAVNPFSVTPGSPVQNMVAGSSQGIHYVLTSPAPIDSPAVVKCTFTPENPSQFSYSFNQAGCVTGVGLFSGLQVDVLLTLTAASGVTTPQKGTLTFQQTNGRGYTINIPITVNVASTSQRTITINNYCTTPPGAGKDTLNNLVIGVITSSVPAKNQYSAQTACTDDSDCSVFTYSTCINASATGPCNGGAGCYCGGGACVSDSDCSNSQAGTCVKGACTYCNGDSDCIQGASCNTASNICYFKIPEPGKYQLNPFTLGGNPDSTTITLQDHSAANGFTQVFNGRITGRVGCDLAGGQYSNCNVGDCGTSSTADPGACNFQTNAITSPATLAEATFIAKTPDTYDLSIIGGVSIPMDFHPTSGSAASPNAYNNPYVCGNSGSITEVKTNGGQQNIGASNWDFTLPTYLNYPVYQLRWVDDSTATVCSAVQPCANGLYCGMTRANEGAAGQTTCGNPLGYWTFNQICTDNNAFTFKNANGDTIASCNSSYNTNTYKDLQLCAGPAAVSCFNVNKKDNTCCGCVNWNTLGIIVPTSPEIVQQCSYPNSYWVGSTRLNAPGALPFIQWLKEACPGCYTYPYDDKTSTYGCPGNNGQSAVNYTIDFCPENMEA
ncbi:thaumatin family protein [Legionella waltersii]|uniref:Thaumatin domain-containing protein n=1 Tax=Legionella waltersii TaxID=66969 RepID=A0A0W1ALZ1_9GAMM|nr:thaumatin family protein [Legionella waltersii]KTD82179.1 Thaumatin domain-containing protein [Legionella waltersii]SNV10530.1 Thaumatin domain-containing protein [Legionella waltersii]